jgi:hypothetical protein
LGYSNGGYVRQKYPELCRAISEKIVLAKRAWPDHVRGVLENALEEQPPPTLSDLSRRLGYSTSTVLRAHEPALCDQLMARRRGHVLERRAALEETAMAVLAETPVPSVRDLCKRLGVTVWFMDKYFPAVRRMVAERHRQCVSAETQQRHKRLHRDVHRIAVELRSQNLYPLATRITERLPERFLSGMESLTMAIREAQKALGIRP